MKILIRFCLILLITCLAVGISTSCSDDNDCSLAGRAMMNCTLFTIDPETKTQLNDTLDSLTVTAMGTDSIIINNMKKVHKLSLPLRYTSDSTVLVFHYDFKRRPTYADTLCITQKNTPYFQSMECGYMMKQLIESAESRKGTKVKGSVQMEAVKVLNKNANTNELQNLEILYKFRDRTLN